MNQPPHSGSPPDWRRPRGVAPGTWKYVNERTIADHYDAFMADAPLCNLDEQFVIDALPTAVREPPVVLDLGCGTGRLAIVLADRGFRVLGIDLSHHMLRQMLAKDRVAPKQTEVGPENGLRRDRADDRAPAANLLAIQANLVELECLAADSADHAICMFSTLGMIQGRSNRSRFLRHVRRAVRENGTLILHVHRRWAALREPGGLKRLFTGWVDSLRRREAEFGDSTYGYRGLGDMFLHRFTTRELGSELRNAGWSEFRVSYIDLTGKELTKSAWNASGFFVVCR